LGKPKASLWLKADGTAEEVRPAGPYWRLQEIQAKVGGYFEIVQRTNLAAGKVMLVDEDGRSKGSPPNAKASTIAGRDIVGDVLIVPAELLE